MATGIRAVSNSLVNADELLSFDLDGDRFVSFEGERAVFHEGLLQVLQLHQDDFDRKLTVERTARRWYQFREIERSANPSMFTAAKSNVLRL